MSETPFQPYITEISLRWKDNDVYGHVNNVDYYSFFDTVINEFLILQGGLDLHGGDAIGLCAESHCAYTAPIAFPGSVRAKLSVDNLGKSSVKYAITLHDVASDDQVAEGWFVHVFVDRATRRPTPIPGTIRAALERIQ